MIGVTPTKRIKNRVACWKRGKAVVSIIRRFLNHSSSSRIAIVHHTAKALKEKLLRIKYFKESC